MSKHIPVLLEQAIELLNIKNKDIVLDGTIGFGGHSKKIYEKMGKDGLLIGIDQDQSAIDYCKNIFKNKENVYLFHANYYAFPDILTKLKIKNIDKVLLDLGISSYQLDESGRGFTYSKEEELDMRMDKNNNLTAEQIINNYSKEKLKQVLLDYGEIRNSDKFLDIISQRRKQNIIKTTNNLIEYIKQGFYFKNNRKAFIRTCARIFQALRIEVNNEINVLKEFLTLIPKYINPGGRLGIITFHSLEDRIIKEYIKENKNIFTKVNKKVIQLNYHEAKANPRARSAKLRVVERKEKCMN